MAAIEVRGLRKVFRGAGQSTVAIEDISFSVSEGEFVSVVGPSGCGKTTLLNIISGVEPATAGTVRLGDGSHGNGSGVRIGYVFQEPRLLPWRRVLDNILYVMNGRQDAPRRKALEFLRMVGLERVAKQWPNQLSGGMQQRVGIARALAVDPALLLMDEPFSHLDAMTARGLRQQLQEIWLQTRLTALFVTHDIAEAVQLSDRIVVLARGGTVREIVPIDLDRPRLSSDPRVGTLQAEIMGRFEDADPATSAVPGGSR